MTSNDLVALLKEAQGFVRHNDKSHTDNCGVCDLFDRINFALSEPVEELPLREENLALRAALACWRNDEDWRAKYLAVSLKLGEANAEIKKLRGKAIRFDLDQQGIESRERDAVALVEARADLKLWEETAQKVTDLFDPLKPKVSPATLRLTAEAAKAANQTLRERVQEGREAAQILIEEIGAGGPESIGQTATRAAEALQKLKEQLEWAVAVQQAALESQERLALEVKGWKQAAEIQEQFKNAAFRERDAARQSVLDAASLPIGVSPLGIAVLETPLQVSSAFETETAKERDILAQQNIELNDACVRYEKALKDARYSLSILASHLDHPEVEWPNYGLKSLAMSYKKRIEEIDAVLKGES